MSRITTILIVIALYLIAFGTVLTGYEQKVANGIGQAQFPQLVLTTPVTISRATPTPKPTPTPYDL